MAIIDYLYTIAASGYWKKEQWQSWADGLIIRRDELEEWIYSVAFAQSKEELCSVIASEKTAGRAAEQTRYGESEVIIGYYYLMYQEGRMSLSELAVMLDKEAELAGGAVSFDFPEAVRRLDRMREGEEEAGSIGELFLPVAKAARGQLEALKRY